MRQSPARVPRESAGGEWRVNVPAATCLPARNGFQALSWPLARRGAPNARGKARYALCLCKCPRLMALSALTPSMRLASAGSRTRQLWHAARSWPSARPRSMRHAHQPLTIVVERALAAKMVTALFSSRACRTGRRQFCNSSVQTPMVSTQTTEVAIVLVCVSGVVHGPPALRVRSSWAACVNCGVTASRHRGQRRAETH